MRPAEARTALYRFYDVHETLLYVGITNDPWRRWRQHVRGKDWYPQVKHQAITWYDTEDEARRAENRAIREEAPQFNLAGAVRPARARVRFRPLWLAQTGTISGLAFQAMMFTALFGPRSLRVVFIPGSVATCLVMMMALLAALFLVMAPQVKRFGAWIERNSVYPAPATGEQPRVS